MTITQDEIRYVRSAIRDLSVYEAVEALVQGLPEELLREFYAKASEPPVPGEVVKALEARKWQVREMIGKQLEAVDEAVSRISDAARRSPGFRDAILAIMALPDICEYRRYGEILRAIHRSYMDVYYDRSLFEEHWGPPYAKPDGTFTYDRRYAPKIPPQEKEPLRPRGTLPSYDPRSRADLEIDPRKKPDAQKGRDKELEALRARSRSKRRQRDGDRKS